MLLQNKQIYVDPFSSGISLTTAEAATHVPSAVWSYMYDDFFEPLCDDVGEGFNNPKLSSIVVPLMNCGCDGSDFKGMPKI